MSPISAPDLPDMWHQLIDDAAIFPPGNAPLTDAIAAFTTRGSQWYQALVGSLVVRDTDLADLRGFTGDLSVVVTGGAGHLAGALGAAARFGLKVAAIEIAVRDVDDPVANVGRIDAAARASEVEVPVFIEIPGPATHTWLAAADEVAACEHRLKFRLGHVEHDLIPPAGQIAEWINAALDRETPFKATAGLHRAVRHDPSDGGAHGFLNVMAATRLLWDGGTVDDAVEALGERDPAALVVGDLGAARRWFTSFGSCSIEEPLEDLITLGLIDASPTTPPTPSEDA